MHIMPRKPLLQKMCLQTSLQGLSQGAHDLLWGTSLGRICRSACGCSSCQLLATQVFKRCANHFKAYLTSPLRPQLVKANLFFHCSWCPCLFHVVLHHKHSELCFGTTEGLMLAVWSVNMPFLPPCCIPSLKH